MLDLADVSQGLYAHVVAASGLGKPGLQVSQDIEYAVRAAARFFEEGELAAGLASALSLAKEAGARNICTIAALLLANACLLHRRLCEVPGLETLPTLNKVGGGSDPASVLRTAWQVILDRDYAPVFEPPLARISHTVTAEGRSGSVGAEFLPREQVEQEQAALRPCFREARVAGTAA